MERVRSLLNDTLGHSLRALREEDRLAAAWLLACGRVLAERGEVVGYADGIVQVEVRDSGWLEQMRSLRGQLEGELARIAGVKVTEIHFVVKR